jgi:glycosyltransferase involved in cell wall biosynthesis
VKVLFVNEKCGYFGGVEQNVASTAEGLRKLNHKCFLAYGSVTERDFDGYCSAFDSVFHCSEILAGSNAPSSMSFSEIVEKTSPDVIYLHKTSSVNFCLPYLGKIRTVRMIHDHDLCCPRRHKYFFHNGRVCHKKAGWFCYLDLAFLERTGRFPLMFRLVSIGKKICEMRRNRTLDCLLVGSRFMQDELIQNGFPREKVNILSPLVPLLNSDSAGLAEEPVILCVAQLVKGKGIDLLLKALSKLTIRFQAIIVGTGNAEKGLKRLCSDLSLDDRVKFQGWAPNNTIGNFYARARVVVVPSRWPEPFGMIGLEAMRCGRPVVAFDVGGVSDWLLDGVTGIIAPEQDVQALADAIHRVLTDWELARKLAQNGKLVFNERFSFDEYLQNTLHYLSGEPG